MPSQIPVTNNVYLDAARLTVQEKTAEALTTLAKAFVSSTKDPKAGFTPEEQRETMDLALLMAAAAGMLGGIAKQARNWEEAHKPVDAGNNQTDNLTSLDV